MTIPVAFVFNPNWWYRNYGISFDDSFYLDRRFRIENDVTMRRALYDRFGIGEPDPKRRPILGSRHVAGGFVVPALFGVPIEFRESEAPCPVPLNLSRDEVLKLRAPDLRNSWPVKQLIEDSEALRADFGCVVGDANTDGVLNMALHLRGQELFVDLYEDPALADHLFGVITETIVDLATLLRRISGTCSVAVNRSILALDPALFLHANCSVEMVSPEMYAEHLFKWDCHLASRLRPYGIHHCGANMQRYLASYARVGSSFFDVGWGSDISQCAQRLPDAFLNLRLSPVQLLTQTKEEVRADAERLLSSAGRSEKVGLCCINMDYDTPDENVLEVIRVACADTARR